jgi:serine/threonine protein kinase
MAIQSIGRYRILRELGRGATATVYLARDPGSGRQVAVKILSATCTAAPDFADRFEQTLKDLARLEHPHLVTPHDYGREADQFFVVMRYLPGGTLADRMDGRPMLLAEVVPILQRLADALDAAHTAHLLHGDLHPADVLFDLHERSFLADLGLAQLLDPVAGPSPTGTAAYMSPEQIAGQPIDGRADIYALGVMLFEMLTGRQPFSGATPQDTLRQHLEQPVPQLSAAVLSHLVLPLEFNLVIARALAKNRDQRYPTAGVLAEAVRATFLIAPADSPQESEVAPVKPPPSAAPPAPPPTLPPALPDTTLLSASAAAMPPTPLPMPPAAETPHAAAPEPVPGPAPEPAVVAPPNLVEIVREPAPAAPPRRGPAPGSLLLGLAGLGLVLVFLAFLRWPDIRAFILPPTATASPTATATTLPTSTPSAVPTATASATPSSTPSATTTPSPTLTATVTASPTATPTVTTAPTATRTATRRPTAPPLTDTSAPPTPTQGTAAAIVSTLPTPSHLGPPPARTP